MIELNEPARLDWLGERTANVGAPGFRLFGDSGPLAACGSGEAENCCREGNAADMVAGKQDKMGPSYRARTKPLSCAVVPVRVGCLGDAAKCLPRCRQRPSGLYTIVQSATEATDEAIQESVHFRVNV